MMQDLKTRLGGLALIVVGLGLGWFFIWQPLDAARHGAHEVQYSLKAFLAVPACVIFGLAFVLLGQRFQYRNAAHTNFTLIGWVLFGLVVLATGGGLWWVQHQFAVLGYR